MKRLSKISVVLLISLLCILGLSTTAFAEETQSSDGLQASIATNSAEYKTNDDIKVELKVKNTNDFDINSVSMNTVVPNGLTVKDNASTSKTVGTLKSGNEESYSIILNVQSTSSGTGTTSTSPQTGNTASTSATTNGESSVGTGDVRNIAVLVIVLVISAVLMIYNRKKLSKHISIMLCFTICLTSIAAVGISSANAAEQDGFTVSKTIKVDDKSYTIGLKISYNKNSITDAVNLTGYKMSEASAYIDNDLYADVEDLSHVAVDSDTRISYFDNEVSFMVNDGVTERDVVDNIINNYDAVIVGKSTVTGRYLIRFNKDIYTYDEIVKIQKELSENSLVKVAYPNYAIEMKDDAFFPQGDLWSNSYDDSIDGENWGIEAINAPQAWDYYNLMDTVEVGVFETKGFYSNHADLRNIVRRVENTQGTIGDHGTHVTGIIAAEFNNRIGINGVSPTARISYIDESTASDDNFNTNQNLTSSFSQCNAFVFLIHNCNCKVVNFSQGIAVGITYHASGNGTDDEKSLARNHLDYYSHQLEDSLVSLLDTDHDFVICSASGNDRNNWLFKTGQLEYKVMAAWNPGVINTKDNIDSKYNSCINYIENQELMDRIIVIGNAERDLFGYSLGNHSNTGERVDVMAPGTKIQSTVTSNPDKGHLESVKSFEENGEKNYYALDTGTSMAAPHVAGIAAILYSLNPNLTGKQIKEIICESATTDVYGTDKKMVDAEAAVKLLLSKGDYYTSPCKYSYERTVVDQNNNPIPDVKVTVTSYFKSGAELNHQDITTNSNGIFKFSEYAGKGKITLEKDGYETVTIEDNFEKDAIYVNRYPVTMNSTATDDSEIFAYIPKEFTFTYGSNWYTTMSLSDDGSFNGEYVDPAAKAYSKFNGKFTQVKKIDDYTYSMKLESLQYEGNDGDIYYRDGANYTIRYPYGFEDSEDFMLYLPGKPLDGLTRNFLSWLKINMNYEVRTTLPLGEYALHNVNKDYGFGASEDNPIWLESFYYQNNEKATMSELYPTYGGDSYLRFYAADGEEILTLPFGWSNDEYMDFEAVDKKGHGQFNIKLNVSEDRSKIKVELKSVNGYDLSLWGGTSNGEFSAEYVRE